MKNIITLLMVLTISIATQGQSVYKGTVSTVVHYDEADKTFVEKYVIDQGIKIKIHSGNEGGVLVEIISPYIKESMYFNCQEKPGTLTLHDDGSSMFFMNCGESNVFSEMSVTGNDFSFSLDGFKMSNGIVRYKLQYNGTIVK